MSYNFHFFLQRRLYLLDFCRETRILLFCNVVVSGFKAVNKLICIKWQPWRAIIVKFNLLLITNCLTKWISDLLLEKDVLTSFTDFILSKEVLTFLISSIPFFLVLNYLKQKWRFFKCQDQLRSHAKHIFLMTFCLTRGRSMSSHRQYLE